MVVVVSGGLTGIGISLRVGMLGVVVAVEVQFRGRESLCCQCKGRGGGEASVRASMDNSGSHDLWACRRLWSRPIHVGIECSRRAGGARSRPL